MNRIGISFIVLYSKNSDDTNILRDVRESVYSLVCLERKRGEQNCFQTNFETTVFGLYLMKHILLRNGKVH